MSKNTYEVLSRSFFLKSKLSHYPVCQSIIPVPQGMSVVLFLSDLDCNEYLEMRGVTDPENFEKVRIVSFYDSMREFAELGYCGVWLYKNFPVLFGNYYSDIDVDLPSFAYTFSDDFFGSSGLIEKPKEFIQWSNCARVDKIIRRFVKFPNGLYFDPSEPVYSIAPSNEEKYETVISGADRYSIACVRFPNASPLQGTYISDMGAYCFFNDASDAVNFLNTRYPNDNQTHSVIEFPSLVAAIQHVECNHPFVDISLNPGSARHVQGYIPAVPNRIILKTVIATYEITSDGVAVEIEPIQELPKADTIDNPNDIEPSYRSLRTLVDHPLKRLRGSTKSPLNSREARGQIEKIFNEELYEELGEGSTIQSIAADSFVMECFDKINGEAIFNVDETAPLIFKDIIEAIQYLYFEILSSDEKVRVFGYNLSQSNFLVPGSHDPVRENCVMLELREALRDLTQTILSTGYRIEHSELLRTFINRNSQTLQIKSCGYVGDLAVLSNGEAYAFNKAKVAGEEDTAIQRLANVSSAFFHRRKDNLSLDQKIQNKIRIHLGEVYENISVASLLILESAIKQLSSNEDRIDHDFAGISMKLCKVFERELSLLVFDQASKAIKNEFDKAALKSALIAAELRNDLTEIKLVKWLMGQGKLELGPMAFTMKRASEPCNTPILRKFRASILELDNQEFLLSEAFQFSCKQILSKFRNGGVHEKIITYEVCKEAFWNILEKDGNFIFRLAHVKPSKLITA